MMARHDSFVAHLHLLRSNCYLVVNCSLTVLVRRCCHILTTAFVTLLFLAYLFQSLDSWVFERAMLEFLGHEAAIHRVTIVEVGPLVIVVSAALGACMAVQNACATGFNLIHGVSKLNLSLRQATHYEWTCFCFG